MIANATNISQRMIKINWLSKEKHIEREKTLYYNYKKVF